MAKSRTVYVCSNCGAESAKWIGKCTHCGEWNTYKEFKTGGKFSSADSPANLNSPVLLKNIDTGKITRQKTGFEELDRVLGGGIVPGSAILIGGDPGIGKSTLVLQTALGLIGKTLYISGEESPEQIKSRADRLGGNNSNCLIYNETRIESIINAIENEKPDLVIIDSVQTIYNQNSDSSPGSVSQIRDGSFEIIKSIKSKNIPAIFIGHITKEGSIAGPKVLEHMVDVVLQFEGDKNNYYRILRGIKNRYGANSELAVFEMSNIGLKEILDTSGFFLDNDDLGKYSGTSVACAVEGIKPFLLEVQVLVSPSVYGTPQRTATGFDYKRLTMLLAVIEKKAGVKLSDKDVFLNLTGGIKVIDPAIDLAVIASVISSVADISIASNTCFIGEVGLTGALRNVSHLQKRVAEAVKLGYSKIFIPIKAKETLHSDSKKIIGISGIKELKAKLF
jgi:DNA repair protein RadA/Sms